MDFAQIIAARAFSCGIALDQIVHCWGEDVGGPVKGLYTQITAAGDGDTACGVMADGKLNCWGTGQVSRMFPTNHNRPFLQISCSATHCCALDDMAYVQCWGFRCDSGECSPPTVTRAQFLSGNIEGDVRAAAKSAIGQTEEEEEEEEGEEVEENEQNAVDSASLQAAAAAEETRVVQFRQISVGNKVSCGITLAGSNIRCWGSEGTHHGAYPRYAAGPFRQVSAGKQGICAIIGSADGNNDHLEAADSLQCWGYANRSFAGLNRPPAIETADMSISGNTESVEGNLATVDPSVTAGWDQISVGGSSICAVTLDSELICRGNSLPHQFKTIHKKFIVA